MKYLLELVNADTRCSCGGKLHPDNCTEDPTAGVETVVATGTLEDLGSLLGQMEAITLGDHNTTYIRVLDPDTGEYLDMHFGPASATAEGGIYAH